MIYVMVKTLEIIDKNIVKDLIYFYLGILIMVFGMGK